MRTVAARATDASGNVGEATRELKVDATAPVTVATVKNLGSSVEVTLTATDAGSGVDRIQWEGPGTFWGTYQEPFTRALTEEPQVIEFAATDAAGNQEVRQRIELPALGEPAEDLAVEVSATAKCVAGKVTVSVRAVNGEDVPVDVKVASAFGSKSFSGRGAGQVGVAVVRDACRLGRGRGRHDHREHDGAYARLRHVRGAVRGPRLRVTG